MTSLQKANQKIKDLKIQNTNLKEQLKQQKEYYEDKITTMQKDFDKKFSSIMLVVSELKERVEILEHENAELRKENKELKEKIEILQNENDMLKGKIVKNSSNSSIPPSRDERRQINHREKSVRKAGGQKGRTGKTLTVSMVEELIKNKNVDLSVEEYGKRNLGEPQVKYILDVETILKIRKIIIHGDAKKEIEKADLPKEILGKSVVIYGDEIKTLVGIMAEEEVIAVDRMSEFIGILTQGKLKVSHGSIVKWIADLSTKCKPIIKKLSKKLKKKKIIYTDLTNTNVSGRKAYIRNYSDNEITIYKPSSSKSINAIKSHNILNTYTGYIMHDHEKGLYNLGIKDFHMECWVHLGRDLKYLTENIGNSWATNLWEFAWDLNKQRKELKENNIYNFTEEQLKEYSQKYDEIIKKGYEENKKVKSKYFRDKELAVLKRVMSYKKNYLLFLEDFELPFDNNLSERDLRSTKTKKKIIGCHRSFEGLKCYCNIRTIISTCKKQGISYYSVLKNIVTGKTIEVLDSGFLCIR